jgi:hypothetical protein
VYEDEDKWVTSQDHLLDWKQYAGGAVFLAGASLVWLFLALHQHQIAKTAMNWPMTDAVVHDVDVVQFRGYRSTKYRLNIIWQFEANGSSRTATCSDTRYGESFFFDHVDTWTSFEAAKAEAPALGAKGNIYVNPDNSTECITVINRIADADFYKFSGLLLTLAIGLGTIAWLLKTGE